VRLNNPMLNCRSTGLVLCQAPIGIGARDGEHGAEDGASVECAGEHRAGSARGVPQQRAPTAAGAEPAKIKIGKTANFSNEISGREFVESQSFVESQFHAAVNPF
jgi:hypothetical protein